MSACGLIMYMNETERDSQSFSALLKQQNVLCMETYRVLTSLQQYQIHLFYAYSTVWKTVLKKYSVCIRKGTWTDGPTPAGPLSVYMCLIESTAFYSFVPEISFVSSFENKKET